MEPSSLIKIRRGREKKIRGFYPWVQSEEIKRVEGPGEPGLARLLDEDGQFLAVGTFNPQSRFPFRVLSREDEPITRELFERRFQACAAVREPLAESTNAWRAVFSEADEVPGLIVDRYGPHGVVQVRSMGMELLRHLWLPALIDVFEFDSVYERSEMAGRSEEGLEPIAQPLHGTPPERAPLHEFGLQYEALIQDGLKTGFYLDQRETRRRFGESIQPGQSVLDTFCYSGAFSLMAAREGADVVGVDLSAEGLGAAKRHAQMNGLSAKFVEANAFEYIEAGAEGKKFDWIILDPPAIAKTQKKRDSLKWALWKLVYGSIPLLNPGGRIIACSCSYQLDQTRLLEACRLAASDRGVRLFLEQVTHQDIDHPVLTQFPESLYLKCAWLRVG